MDTTTALYLIRHGETYNPDHVLLGRSDAPLSTDGVVQVETLAGALRAKNVELAAIFTSPVRRALETATIVKESAFSTIPLVVREELSEVDYGRKVINQPLGQIGAMGDLFARGFTQESQEDIARRMMRVVGECVEEYRGCSIAIVGHRDPLVILRYSLQNPGVSISPMRDLYKLYDLDTAEYCILTGEGGTWVEKEPVQTERISIMRERGR